RPPTSFGSPASRCSAAALRAPASANARCAAGDRMRGAGSAAGFTVSAEMSSCMAPRWNVEFPLFAAHHIDSSPGGIDPAPCTFRNRRSHWMNVIRTAMLLALMTALFMGVGYLIGGEGGMMIAFLIAGAMNIFGYWNADKMVLRMHNAVEVDERNAPEYYAIVKALAERAGLPMPRVYLIDQPQPNAFATGRNP